MPVTVAPNNRAYTFGGVLDTEKEDDDDISGTFYNELYCLDLEKNSWRELKLNKKSQQGGDDAEPVSDEEPEAKMVTTADDGIFTVSVGPAPSVSSVKSSNLGTGSASFWPSPRMNCGLAVKRGVLYLYGGMIEDGSKQLTLNDFYSLDLHKMDDWKVIIKDDLASQEWLGSDSESEGEEDDDDDDESSSDEDSSMDTD